MQLLIAQPIIEKTKQLFDNQPLPQATLAIVLVGNDESSEAYIRLKKRIAEHYGVTVTLEQFDIKTPQNQIIQAIKKLNSDPQINGIIVQLPIPENFDADAIIQAINPKKDVDNLTGAKEFESPMVQSVRVLIDFYGIDLANKKITLVGFGRLIGQPLRDWLVGSGIEPMIVDASTQNGDEIIKTSDILFAGTGVHHRINSKNTRKGQIIFDCSGVDVDFDKVKNKSAAITPPKGAIGPLTVHFLFMNVLQADGK